MRGLNLRMLDGYLEAKIVGRRKVYKAGDR